MSDRSKQVCMSARGWQGGIDPLVAIKLAYVPFHICASGEHWRYSPSSHLCSKHKMVRVWNLDSC